MSHPESIHVEYLLEDLCEEVLQFSPISVTWKANDRSSALVATSVLLAKGFTASHYHSHHSQAWCVQANF